MPAKTLTPPVVPEFTNEQIDQLIAHPHWESLGEHLDALIKQIPGTAETCARTTVLSWIYLERGVIAFLEFDGRVTGFEHSVPMKKHLRTVLRGLERLHLVRIDNFDVDAKEPAAKDGELGSTSLITLTWLGMVWMRRAWQARARLAASIGVINAHRQLVDEEDEGKANDPFWVDNILSLDGKGAPAARLEKVRAEPSITSVFDLAATAKGSTRRRR